MKEKNKELTLENIAKLIDASARKTIEALEVKIEKSAEDLATSTQKQFLELEEKLEKKIDGLKTDVAGLKKTVDNIEANLNKKVDTITHNTLEYRVEKMEKKYA